MKESISTNNGNLLIEDFLFEDYDYSQSSHAITSKKILFKNCTFKEPINFNSIFSNCQVGFHNCKFLSSVKMERVRFRNLEFYSCEFERFFPNKLEVKQNESLLIENSEIDYNFTISKGAISRGVKFYKVVFNRFHGSKIKDHFASSIELNNCKVKEMLHLDSIRFNGAIRMFKSEVVGVSRYENCHCKNISFTDNVFKELVIVWAGSYNDIIFNDGTFYKDFVVNAVYFKSNRGTLSIHRTVFNQSFKLTLDSESTRGPINGVLPARIYINDVVCESNWFLSGECHNSSGKKKVSSLEVACSPKLMGKFLFSDFEVESVLIKGNNVDSSISFERIVFDKFRIENFTNHGIVKLFSLFGLRDKSELLVLNSFLGDTQLFNLDFGKLNKIVIIDSHLSEINTTNVTWPDEIFSNQEEEEVSLKELYSRAKETYRQLKISMQKHGNKVLALKFEELEMNSYLGVLKNSNGKRWERFIVWSNKHSNAHGQNWWKPFILNLGFGLLFFLLIIYSMDEDYTFVNSRHDSFKEFRAQVYEHFGFYFRFLNPAHSLRFDLPNAMNSNWAMFWDVLLRISSSYFIFQMIRAFRKYTR